MRVDVDISQLSRAIRDISRFDVTTRRKLKDAIHESALNIQKGAKRRCPVDTGRLRSSITIQPIGNEGMTLQVGTKVFYAPYVEWGTGKYSDHPEKSGRLTPWAFPVSATSGRKHYKWKVIEDENGTQLYVTQGAKPHPFLFPSFEEEKPKFIQNVREALQ